MVTRNIILRFAVIIGVLFISIAILFSVWNYLFPFVAAVIMAWLMQPSIRWLHTHFKLPKALAIILLLCSISLLLISLTTLLLTRAIYFFKNLSNEDFSSYVLIVENIYSKIIEWLDRIFGYIHTWAGSLSLEGKQTFYESMDNTKQAAVNTGMKQLRQLLELFTEGLTHLPYFFMSFGICLMATFFLSKDWDKIKGFTAAKLPVQTMERISQLSNSFKHNILQMIKAHIILMMITIFLVFTGLTLISAPHPLLIALTAGLLDLIPYVGTGVIFIPWIIYLFFTENYTLTIPLAFLYMIILIIRQLVEPKVLSSQFGVHPLILLAGLFLGFQIWGGYALIISPLIISFSKAVISSGLCQHVWAYIIKS
ncbi:sporulation integral membrane protein YtvI [Halobacillus massiliensis]|uniref:sporulation integral membrane protein YtvI n=1 Tax=Halobacillus massiliensis TaxID=1926286 RepID=UPI0009E4BD10|nr:sporulation integral membrane protein YtvI [Halobacillus massiliensis]